MILDYTLLHPQHYKDRIKSKWCNPEEASFPTSQCSCYRKGNFRVHSTTVIRLLRNTLTARTKKKGNEKVFFQNRAKDNRAINQEFQTMWATYGLQDLFVWTNSLIDNALWPTRPCHAMSLFLLYWQKFLFSFFFYRIMSFENRKKIKSENRIFDEA